MVPGQRCSSKVDDSDVVIGGGACFLCCISYSGSTARLSGPTLQALHLSDLHRVTWVSFLPLYCLQVSNFLVFPFVALRLVASTLRFCETFASSRPQVHIPNLKPPR